MIQKNRTRLMTTAALVACGWATTATAQTDQTTPDSGAALNQTPRGDSLEEIVVTARRREENLQTTPVAVSIVTARTLEARNVVNLEGISRIVPNFFAFETSGAVGGMGAGIRGISHIDGLIGQDAPIGIYLDGVVTSRFTVGLMNLVSPERVEVLRGPQGTLFGRNTTAGAINIVSHTPTDEFSGAAKASYGSYSARVLEARIDTGLIAESGIKLSMAYHHDQRNGTHDSGLRPRRLDPGAQTNNSYWAKAVGQWGRLSATLSADYTETSGVGSALQIIDATPAWRNMLALSPTYGGGTYPLTLKPLYHIANDTYAGLQHVWIGGAALNVAYEFSPNITLKSISGLRGYDRDDPNAYGPANLRVNTGTVAAPVITTFNGLYAVPVRGQHQKQVSEELQLLGQTSDLNYVAGFYYYKENARDNAVTNLPFALGTGATALNVTTSRLYTTVSRSTAGYGQASWRPSWLQKKLELTGGIRWTRDTRDFDQTLSIIRKVHLKTSNFSYLLSGSYQWTDGLMTYIKYSTGYRAGGFNARTAASANPIFLPEKIKSLEGGFKLDAFDRHLRINAAAFYNKYSNLQTSQFAPPGQTDSSGGAAVFNSNATYKGFEIEVTARPIEHLTLTASFGYTDPTYQKYPRGLEGGQVVPGCTPINNSAGVPIGMDCADIARFTNSPKKTADLSAVYSFPETRAGVPSLQVTWSYKGPIEWGAFSLPSTPFANVIRGGGYGLLGARFTLSEVPFSSRVHGTLAVFGDNLTNERYKVTATDFGFMGAASYGTRRTVGLEVRADF